MHLHGTALIKSRQYGQDTSRLQVTKTTKSIKSLKMLKTFKTLKTLKTLEAVAVVALCKYTSVAGLIQYGVLRPHVGAATCLLPRPRTSVVLAGYHRARGLIYLAGLLAFIV